jgi:very-short-patch-repair endonuclease
MDGKVAKRDTMVAEIAARQHGVVSVDQLRRVGVTDDAIRARFISGRLYRVHRGVYAVGHAALSREGCWLAAVLAVGRGPAREGGSPLDHWRAAVSHRSAACLWDLLSDMDGPVHVAVRGNAGRAKRRGIRLYRSLTLLPAEVTLRRGVPVTTPARTISDLRQATSEGRQGAISSHELRRAIRQAGVLGLPIGDQGAIGDGRGDDRTLSDLELDFLRLCRRHRLPPPEVNVPIGSHLVDFLWRDRRLIVETDSYLYHRGEGAFRDDRSRDLDLKSIGYEVVRLSEDQINEESDQVAKTLAVLLDRSR